MIVPESVVALGLMMAVQQAAPPQTVQSSVSRSFTGVLMDTQNTTCEIEVEKAVPKGTCPASFRTTNFGLALQGGQNVKFDEAGNALVVEALRRSKRGAKALFDYWRTGKVTTAVRARAVGTLTSDTLNLESIQID
jgi:hypothetical protein